jgi:hypothetical protein
MKTASRVEFDPFSDDCFNAPFETYRRLRNEAPVYHNEKYGSWHYLGIKTSNPH